MTNSVIGSVIGRKAGVRAGRVLVAAAIASLAGAAAAQDTGAKEGLMKDGSKNESGTTITIYSSAQPGAVPASAYRPVPPSIGGGYNPWAGQPVPGYAIVKAERTMKLVPGRNTVRFTDVAALIDPTTVLFESLTAPATTRVVEQSYQFDLVSPQKILDRYLGRTIQIDGVSGKLLSAAGNSAVLQLDDGTVRMYGDTSKNAVFFPSLPGGLITTPTLVWDLATQKDGEHKTRVSYLTEGVTWWADYNIVYEDGADANSAKLDVGAWVSILNQSGATYENTKLKLVAGDVQRAQPKGGRARMEAMGRVADMAMAPGFEEKSFFEYHLYTLGRPSTIGENSTKQIELFPAAMNVPAEKALVYYGLEEDFRRGFGSPMTDRDFGVQGNKKVDVYLKFKNDKEKGLGMPLPAGRIRVSKLDPADKSLEFIGEDILDHTPQGEDVLIKMGSAFDVVGERIQVDFNADLSRRRIEETIQVKVRNRKKEAVTVIVKENLYRWTNWEIVQKSADFQKIDSRTIHFPVRIEPDKEAVVTYKVRYSW